MNHLDLTTYLPYSLKLVAKPRRGGGNMFRHQMETMAILMEYGYTEPVLLKASLIHDLLEEEVHTDFHDFNQISIIDEDGPEVLALVQEVSRRVISGQEEPKSEFLLRIMLRGSAQAKILKLADRISNISWLPMAVDKKFILDYIAETEKYILPYADEINRTMYLELKNRLGLILNTFQNEHTTS